MSSNPYVHGRRAASPTTVTMWKARYVNPHTGEISFVQTQGTPLENGAHIYTDPVHKGHLICAHCAAKVHHRKGPHGMGGNSASGHDNHFATNRGQKHGDDCKWEFPEPWESNIAYDDKRGWRIHINVPIYNEAIVTSLSGVYRRVAGGRIRTKDENLRSHKPLSVESANDVVALIEKGDVKRLTDSIVIFRNQSLSWKDFCIRYDAPSRYLALIKRMQEKKDAGAKNPETFGFFEFRTDKSHAFYRGAKPVIEAPAIVLPEKDRRGKPQNVVLKVDMRGTGDARALVAFEGYERSFMILGGLTHRRHEGPHNTTHYLTIKVASGEQIAPVVVKDLWEKVSQKTAAKGDFGLAAHTVENMVGVMTSQPAQGETPPPAQTDRGAPYLPGFEP